MAGLLSVANDGSVRGTNGSDTSRGRKVRRQTAWARAAVPAGLGAALALLLLLQYWARSRSAGTSLQSAVTHTARLHNPQGQVLPLLPEAHCELSPPLPLDNDTILHRNFGSHFEAARPGRGSILVFGNHKTGTSMFVRLVMLMGAFGGDMRTLHVFSGKNPLKYWEPFEVFNGHDKHFANITDPHFWPWHAQDVDFARQTPDALNELRCMIKNVKQKLDRHPPWVMKDPRTMYFAQDWLAEIRNPVCLYIFRNPIENGMRLYGSRKTSRGMTAERWIGYWEQGTLNTMAACAEAGAPTFIFRLEDFRVNLTASAERLVTFFDEAGVHPVALPTATEMNTTFDANIKPQREVAEEEEKHPELTLSQKALWYALDAMADDAPPIPAAQVAPSTLKLYLKQHSLLYGTVLMQDLPVDRKWYCAAYSKCCPAFASYMGCSHM